MSISTLYKYKSLSTTEELKHARSLVCDSELYFSSPLAFNDPFECRPVFTRGKTEEGRRKILREALNREPTPEEMESFDGSISRDVILKKLEGERVGMCCFSEVGDEVLLYSHYASAHQGFCLEFGETDETPLFGEVLKVNYTDWYPIVNPEIYSKEENMEHMYLSKSKKWEYERECRLIIPHTANTVHPFPEELLKGVIFGCRMDEDYKIFFREWAKKRKRSPPLRFYQAKEKEKEYGLDIDPVD